MKRFIIVITLLLTWSLYGQTFYSNGYKITREIKGNADLPEKTNRLVYTFYKTDGTNSLSIEKNVEYDIPYPSAGMVNGNLFYLADAFTGKIEFYNRDGFRRQTVQLTETPEPEYERALYTATGAGKALFLVELPKKERIKAVTVNDKTEIISEEYIEKTNASGVAIDPANGTMAVSAFSWEENGIDGITRFYSENGSMLSETDKHFKYGVFTEGRFTGATKKEIFTAETETGKIINSENIKNGYIAGLGKVKGEIVIMKAESSRFSDGEWQHTGLSLYEVSAEGTLKKIAKEMPDKIGEFYLTDEGINYNNMVIEIN